MEELTAAERRQVEIELLQAMYPEQIQFFPQGCELRYSGTCGGTLVLRIPDEYPERGLPDLISASDATKSDVRTMMTAVLDDMRLLQGEEVLDAIIQGFEEILTTGDVRTNVDLSQILPQKEKDSSVSRWKTVVVWLHHLLNTNKRKLALNPTNHAATDGGIVSGITKPGYPGILLYSGPTELVDAHVAELKQQRWQAFQVRYEQDYDSKDAWKFSHGLRIVEVENMADMVHSIVDGNNREAFLRATGVK